MKAAILGIVLIAIIAAGGYVGLPLLIDSRTASLRAEVTDLKGRLQTIENDAKSAPLSADADAGRIIKTVNALAARTAAIDNALTEAKSSNEAAMHAQRLAMEESLKKQVVALDRLSKDMDTKLQKSIFSSFVAVVRGHVLKVKVELAARNIGTAKDELELIAETFEKAKTSAGEEQKQIIGELQATVKKIRSEVDSDLPAAANRVDVLWHDMSRLLRN